MIKHRCQVACLVAASLFAACTSNIRPMRPLQKVKVWVPDIGASASATQPATQTAATSPSTQSAQTQPTTQPGHYVTQVIDPNETSRYIYKASYDNIWRQAMDLLYKTGFALDRKDYRLGVLTTQPLPSAQIVEPLKPQQANAKDALENTINNQQRLARITISPVPSKPDFYKIAVQVIVQRQSNPTEEIGGPVFIEGSGFGRSMLSLRSDYTPADKNGPWPSWYVVGHDPNLERKLLNELFARI